MASIYLRNEKLNILKRAAKVWLHYGLHIACSVICIPIYSSYLSVSSSLVSVIVNISYSSFIISLVILTTCLLLVYNKNLKYHKSSAIMSTHIHPYICHEQYIYIANITTNVTPNAISTWRASHNLFVQQLYLIKKCFAEGYALCIAHPVLNICSVGGVHSSLKKGGGGRFLLYDQVLHN